MSRMSLPPQAESNLLDLISEYQQYQDASAEYEEYDEQLEVETY